MEQDKYFQGANEIVFRDFGRSMHYFKGAREHRLGVILNENVLCLRNFFFWVVKFNGL